MTRRSQWTIGVAVCLTLIACPTGGGGEDDGAADTTSALSLDAGDGAVLGEGFEPSPGGIRRLLRHQYVGSIRLLLGDQAAAAAAPAPDYSLHGFDAIGAAVLALPASAIEAAETSARAVAIAAVEDRQRLAEAAPCVLEAAPAADCYQQVAAEFGRLAWRRPLVADEVRTLVAIAEAGEDWGQSFASGLQYELMALLQSPHFLYMIEVGEPDPEEPTRRVLTPLELASRMSFFLLGQTPDAGLLAQAEAGALATEAEVRAAAEAMLERAESRATLAIFYGELLRLRDLPGLAKSAEMYPQFTPALAESMAQETLRLIEDIVWVQDGDIRGLLDAEYTVVDAGLAQLYGAPAPEGPGFEAVALPDAQGRAGILGHASFLARFAHPALTSPTRRGQFIRTRLLCDVILPPPPGVDTTLPASDPDAPQTMKDKLMQHVADPSCAGCHQIMDPLGLALEHFDALGIYRAEDQGLPIDVSVSTPDLGAFSGARELAALLVADRRTSTCVIKNFIRAGLGRLEGRGERSALADLEDTFSREGRRVRHLLVELVASPIFRVVGEPK